MIEARPSEGKDDAAVFSLPAFAQQLPIPQFLVHPSTDPLADKNRRMSAKEVKKALERLGVPDDKPIMLQVSRFDRFKEPIGVINAYKLVKATTTCASSWRAAERPTTRRAPRCSTTCARRPGASTSGRTSSSPVICGTICRSWHT